MPDISMCPSKDCEARQYCYRATTTPNKFWQSYFSEQPEKDALVVVGTGKLRLTISACKYFWGIEGNKKLVLYKNIKGRAKLTAAGLRRDNGFVLWNDV